MLQTKRDLTDEEIREFLLHADRLFQDWIRINKGRAGITNYIHLLGAGHISEYLFHWRNLGSHSQQGWEAWNSLIKTFFL